MVNPNQCELLIRFARRLVDQTRARVIVPPYADEPGYWFGGGNMIAAESVLWLVGRYRNFGDSRSGLTKGTRGLELAIFRSDDGGETFDKRLSFSKDKLSTTDHDVLSIEGSSLRARGAKVELLVSTEKDGIGYPPAVESYLKPGAGVWAIDRLQAKTVDGLKHASVLPLVSSTDPSHLHVKDPFCYSTAVGDLLFACSHPFSWSSSNTVLINEAEGFAIEHGFFPRGASWDVAISRGTCLLDVPQVGFFEVEPLRLLFYDGGECMRPLDEHRSAVTRPRGYSCEELGGLAVMPRDRLDVTRLSEYEPLFVSPYGTGCSRYVDVLETDDGFYTTWQQAQDDGSQPLVVNFLSRSDAESILGGA